MQVGAVAVSIWKVLGSCRKFPWRPETAHLTDLPSRFPRTVGALMSCTNVVLHCEGALNLADRELITPCIGAGDAYPLPQSRP